MIIAAAVLLLINIPFFFLFPRQIFKPRKAHIALPQFTGAPVENIHFFSGTNKLHAWHFPVRKTAQTVMFIHGGFGNMSYYLDTIEIFTALGLNVFTYDFSGYGNSTGIISEKRFFADAENAYRFLREEKKTPESQLILAGHSIGAAAAVRLAGTHGAAAVITDGAFRDMRDVSAYHLPLFNRFFFLPCALDAKAGLAALTCPVFAAHAEQDTAVGLRSGKKFFAAVPSRKVFLRLPAGNHHDAVKANVERLREALTAFLKTL